MHRTRGRSLARRMSRLGPRGAARRATGAQGPRAGDWSSVGPPECPSRAGWTVRFIFAGGVSSYVHASLTLVNRPRGQEMLGSFGSRGNRSEIRRGQRVGNNACLPLLFGGKAMSNGSVQSEDPKEKAHLEQVKLLFDYTKFHIGLYTTLAGVLIAALGASFAKDWQIHP